MDKNYKMGLTAIIGCNLVWGLLPIYWKMLIPIPSSVIIFYRIVLVGLCTFLACLKLYGFERIKEPLKIKGNKIKFFVAGAIIAGNWSIYIWAVNAGHIVQTSVGYYIQPLIVCLFGIVLFKEKLTKYKITALAMAVVGVIVIIVHFGEAPIIALSLAISFAVYGAFKKTFKVEALLSLLYETMFLVPFALAVIIYMEVSGKGAIGVGEPYQYGLLMLAGIMTAVPLGLFASAAKNLPLVTVGVASYISPSMALILGIFLYGEPFDKVQFASFVLIWIGLAVFTYGEKKEMKKE
ncbi:MAG: EamA family transporter RarD [Eubacterium sp.]|nr:EamA family transporter RarD [Eubacterium sp.]